MTNWDKESELILEWLRYRINWFTYEASDALAWQTRHKSYNLNVFYYWGASRHPECLTFEEWKQFENK